MFTIQNLFALSVRDRVARVAVTTIFTLICLQSGCDHSPDASDESELQSNATSDPEHIHLTAAKLVAAKIEIGTAENRTLQRTITLPGRLTYDEDRHVAITAPCNGILKQVAARPGNEVKQGETLATLSSPEIATARVRVRDALAAYKIAEQERKWNGDVCTGVEKLIEMVRDERSPTQIEAALKSQSLGSYREQLMSAYSRTLLAKQLADSSKEAAESGAIPGRLQKQRETEMQVAEAARESVLEQSLYEVQLSCSRSSVKLNEAQRQVELAQQALDTLLGPTAKRLSIEQLETLSEAELPLVDLISPIQGTVEKREFSSLERVPTESIIFVIADTSNLWVVSDVRQKDWEAMSISVGAQLPVTVPALPDIQLLSEVIIVGRAVDVATGAAELVSRLSVSDYRLRPGMFVRVQVPVGELKESVTVPEQSVVMHEGQSFVFVPDSGNSNDSKASDDSTSFRRIDVTCGLTTDGFTEIESGLLADAPVVVEGVFQLKSELLLAGESE